MILRRNDSDRFSAVVPEWRGKTAVILGGGPSLTPEQIEIVGEARRADRVRVIAVNDAYLWAPWADVHYAADAKWHAWHAAGIPKPLLGLTAEQVRERWAAFAGERCSIECSSVEAPGVHLLRNKHFPVHGTGLSLDPRFIVSGRNSGFQALNIAVLAGASDVLLLGFDGKPAKDGKSHWHGDHPVISSSSVYDAFRRSFSAAERDLEAAGVRVINCSPGSAIDSFPKMPIADALGVAA